MAPSRRKKKPVAFGPPSPNIALIIFVIVFFLGCVGLGLVVFDNHQTEADRNQTASDRRQVSCDPQQAYRHHGSGEAGSVPPERGGAEIPGIYRFGGPRPLG